MQYLLQLTFRPGEAPEEGTPEYDADMERWHALNDELKAAGHYVAASGLQVRGRDARCARTAARSS